MYNCAVDTLCTRSENENNVDLSSILTRDSLQDDTLLHHRPVGWARVEKKRTRNILIRKRFCFCVWYEVLCQVIHMAMGWASILLLLFTTWFPRVALVHINPVFAPMCVWLNFLEFFLSSTIVTPLDLGSSPAGPMLDRIHQQDMKLSLFWRHVWNGWRWRRQRRRQHGRVRYHLSGYCWRRSAYTWWLHLQSMRECM